MKNNFRLIWLFAKNFKSAFALLLFCIIVTTFMGAAYPYLFGRLVDEVFYDQNMTVFVHIVLLYAGIFFVGQLLHFTLNMSWAYLMTRFLFQVRKALFDKTLSLPAKKLHDMQTGDIVKRMRDDAGEFMNFTHWNLFYLSAGILNLIISLGMIFYFNVFIGVISLAAAPLAALITRRFGDKAKQVYAENRRLDGIFQSWFFEILKGLGQIITLGASRRVTTQFTHRNNDVLRQSVKASRIELTAERVTAGITLAAQLALYASAAYFVWQGEFTVGAFVSSLAYFTTVARLLNSLSQKGVAIHNNMAGINRVSDLLEQESEMLNQHTPFTISKGEVSFRQVSFSYTETQVVIKDLTLHIASGEQLALVGKSGAGKSTLAALLLAFFHPHSGSISIDGQDLSKVNKQHLREQMGIVWQDPLLFEASVRENLLIAKPDAQEAELISSLEKASLWDFVSALPQGLDTILGQKGHGLSGGQKQRLVIARILLKDPRILIFDEATSSLDTENEQAIQQAWNHLAKGRTIIIIAHRLSTIQTADRVAVLDGGAIIACDHHSRLRGSCSIYDELYAAQYSAGL